MLLKFPLFTKLKKPRDEEGKFSDSVLTEKIGVYMIRNLKNQKIYVGGSTRIWQRRTVHIRSLEANCHKNKKLQNDFNNQSKEDFEFQILEFVQDKSKLEEKEQYWIDKLLSTIDEYGYNYGTAESSQIGNIQSEETKIKRAKAISLATLWRLS